jgi:trehalose 6-phosphate synthase
MLVAHFLRELGITQSINFFLHIPFPSLDMFRRLPGKNDLLQALLSIDHIGFQTPADRRNFIACIRWLFPQAKHIQRKRRSVVQFEGREITVGHYPISIDFDEFNRIAHSQEVHDATWYLRENIDTPDIVLGLDRLDYTKGIPERFQAFERLIEKYPELIGKIALLQIVVPSRLNVPEYQQLKNDLDALAGRINSRFSQQGWVPIHYQFRELDRIQLLGHYRAADIALVTPLRDGMNLVSKEYCAGSIDDTGVLILSEFAGAAAQLANGAIIVNPFDFDGTADAIYAAYVMPVEEKQARMRKMRAEVKRNNVRRWVEWFFGKTTIEETAGYRPADDRQGAMSRDTEADE